jgi:hypothetical protein
VAVVIGEMNMAVKWKAFAVWIALPYLSYVVVLPIMLLIFRHDADLVSIYRLRHLVFLLAICTVLATFGIVTVWVLPIRRAWVGILSGLVAAIGGIALGAWFEMTFYGGFEENIGIYFTALFLAPPSCLAGAYAGFLRSRESQAGC